MGNVRNTYGNVLTIADAERLGVIDAAEFLVKPINKPIEARFLVDVLQNPLSDLKETNMTEEEKAELSKRRGQAATKISDPEKRKNFIAEQGRIESKGDLSGLDAARLESENQAVTATDGKKGLDSYHKGGIVKKTGPANLLKGEKVIPKDQVMALAEGPMAHGEDKPAKKAKKRVKSVHVRRGAKKGFIAENHHDSMDHPMEEHPLANMDELHAHMQSALGDEPEAVDNAQEESAE